jgi:hypothetical protein
MTTSTMTREPQTAIVWITRHCAAVAASLPGGEFTTAEIERRDDPEPRFLAHVVEAIGEHDRVMILGPSAARLALEREYVAISHRPDRLVPVPPYAPGATTHLGDLRAA